MPKVIIKSWLKKYYRRFKKSESEDEARRNHAEIKKLLARVYAEEKAAAENEAKQAEWERKVREAEREHRRKQREEENEFRRQQREDRRDFERDQREKTREFD